MPASHLLSPKPSPLLALVCLAVVHRLRPMWLAVSLTDAAACEQVSPQRLSRIASRAIALFEDAVAALARRGRPPSSHASETSEHELAIVRALLEVARSLLAQLRCKRGAARALLLGAWLRLHDAHPSLTQRRFCEELALPTRTLRHWLAQTIEPVPTPAGTTPAPASPGTPTARARPPRRPRFRHDVVLPDTQHAADTTDLCAFGVPLKLLALQDVGGRDQDLFDAVIVEPRESAETVVRLIHAALAGLPGAQLLTDQGTPYMARETREAIAQLELEHAPQKEGDPIGKSTIERAFGTAKTILAPLLAVTDRIAARVPALADPELARATVDLLVSVVLHAYQAGARATRRALDARGALSPEELAQAADAQRKQSRADNRSSRLILSRIHAAYSLPGSALTFVNSFRGYAPEVLLEAEKRFGSQVHRDDIRDHKRYFAAIVRAVHDEHHRARLRELADREAHERIERLEREDDERLARWYADPIAWLRDALDSFADQWRNCPCTLRPRCGIGHAWAKLALHRLVELHGAAARDLAAALVHDWSHANLDRLGPDGIGACLAPLAPYLDALPTLDDKADCAARFAAAILRSTGPPRRPAPQRPLRI